MTSRDWGKSSRNARMNRNGVELANEPAAAGKRFGHQLSKDELRRHADQLLAGYTGPVKKIAAGVSASPVIGSQVTRSADGPQMRLFGSLARSKAARCSKRERRSSGERPQIDRAIPPGLVIYCDGACEPNPGAGGWGFVVYQDGREIHADSGGSDPTTNNVMELTGALRALEWFAERGVIEPVRLFCDSMYVVNGCNDWRHGWKARGWRRKGKDPVIANLALWQELDAALTLVPTNLEWCRGHVGIIGNERADDLSLMGRESVLALKTPNLIEQQLNYEIGADL